MLDGEAFLLRRMDLRKDGEEEEVEEKLTFAVRELRSWVELPDLLLALVRLSRERDLLRREGKTPRKEDEV